MMSRPVKRNYTIYKYGQLHYRIAEPETNTGDTPLICFHMSPYSSAIYENFISVTGARRQSIAIDTPGFGNSDPTPYPPLIEDYASAMSDALDNLGITKAHILGFHTGSAIANEIAIHEPELISEVIFVTYPFFDAAKRAELLESQTKGSIDESIDCLKGMWEFTITNRSEGISIERAYENFIDQVKNMSVSWYGFYSMFNYPSEERLPLLQHVPLIVNDTSSLTEPTKIAMELVHSSEYVELEDVKGGIFELNTDQIIEHVSHYLGE